MSLVEKIIHEIDDKYCAYRDRYASFPKYFVLSLEARQAIKIRFSHPYSDPMPDIKEYMGYQVIPLEECILVSTKKSEEVGQ